MEIPRLHTAHLVTDVLGVQPFLDKEQGALTLSEVYKPDPDETSRAILDRELIYLRALRAIANARQRERPQTRNPLEHWTPSEAAKEEIRGQLLEERKHLHTLNTFEPFVHNTFHKARSTQLRPYQEEDFTRHFHRFMTTSDPADPLKKAGLFDLPPSYGKSALGVVACQSIGVGQPILPQEHTKRRALYVTPSREAIEQMQEHFARHAPEITVGSYYEEEKSLDGAVLLTTYASARQLHKQRLLHAAAFSLVIFDEVHYLDGPQTFKMAQKLAESSICVGLTATPTSSTAQLFGNTIAKMGLREAIETADIVNSAQIFATLSDETIFPAAGTQAHEDYAEEQIKHLMHRHGRNAKMLLWAKHEIAQGRIGMIDCIPGERSRHARQLAAALSEMEITDPATGEQRRIKAEAVGNFQSERQNAETLARLRQKEIDAVFTVSKATEAFDCPELNFIIKGRPTKSLRNYVQMIGRGLRKAPDKPPTTIIDIVDTVWDASQRQLTGFDIFNETMVVQGLTITPLEQRSFVKAPDQRPSSGHKAHLYRPVPAISVPDALRQALTKTDNTPIAALGVLNSAEDTVQLETIDAISASYDIPESWARAVLNHAGYRAKVSYRKENNTRTSILRYPSQVRDFLDEKLAPPDYKTLPVIAEELGITLAGLHARIKRLQQNEKLGDINEYYKRDTYVNCRPFLHCSPTQRQLLMEDFNGKESPVKIKTEAFAQVNATAQRLGIHRDYCMRYLKAWTTELTSLRNPESNRTTQCTSQVFADAFVAQVEINSTAKPTELLSFRSVSARVRDAGLTNIAIPEIIKKCGITPKPALRNGNLEATFTPEEVDAIVAACIVHDNNKTERVKRALGEDNSNLSVLATNNRIPSHVLRTIISYSPQLRGHIAEEEGEIFGDALATASITHTLQSISSIPDDWFELRDFARRAELDPDTLLHEIRSYYPEKSSLQNIYLPDADTLTYCSPRLLLKAAAALKKRQ